MAPPIVPTDRVGEFGSVTRRCGTVAPIVALGGIFLATLLDPTFSWTTDALSDLGIREESAIVFNSSLILAGGLGLGYAVALWREIPRDGTTSGPTDDSVDLRTRATIGVIALMFGLSMVAMAGVGLFPIGHDLHFPSAVVFYLLFTVVMTIDGLVRRSQSTGRVTLGLVALHVITWVLYVQGIRPGPGLAIPVIVGAIILAIWVWWTGPVPAGPRT